MREEPDAGALVRDGLPVAQRVDLVELGETGAGIARRLADGEHVAALVDLQTLDVLQKIDRSAAAVTWEHEADALCFAHVRDLGLFAHGDDVRAAEGFGDVLGHVEAVAGAGPAEDDSVFHGYRSFTNLVVSIVAHRGSRRKREAFTPAPIFAYFASFSTRQGVWRHSELPVSLSIALRSVRKLAFI